MKNILFRADSSSTIGTGHIMRDLVLAEQFNDANIIFAAQALKGNINHKIKEKNYIIEIINSNEVNEIVKLIKKYEINMVVIDHYGVDYTYEKNLKDKTGITLFVLDDTYEKHYCDILLNNNIYADEKKYKNLVPYDCEIRCGTKYTLLRKEFIEEKNNINAIRKQSKITILIAMGGTDHSNTSIDILKVLETFSNIKTIVVTTSKNKYLNSINEYVENNNINITLHVDTNQIARLICTADFVIVTPSVIMNEILYMGLPFIAIKTAENQNEMTEYLEKKNYFVLDKFDYYKLKSKIELMIGKSKIERVNFYDLSLNERKMVLTWRNNPSIKKWMLTQDDILFNDHIKFISSLKSRKDIVYFLVKKGTDAIGVIDFKNIGFKDKTVEFGIYSNPGLKGVGNLLMNSIIDYAFGDLKVDTLISKVLKENIPAIKLYIRYNFNEIEVKNINGKNIIYMELKNENC